MRFMRKIILIFLLSSFLLLLFSGFCFAQKKLEIIYPKVPRVETPTTTKTALPDYLRYIFNFAITISGIVAFGVMVYGGILYVTSAGDPSKISDAKDQIIASFLGLIIILSSFLILNTVNPQLVIPGPQVEAGKGGIVIYSNSYDCGVNPLPGKEITDIESKKVISDIKNLNDSNLGLDWGTDGTNQITSIEFLGNPGDLIVYIWSKAAEEKEGELDFSGDVTVFRYPETEGDTNPCKTFTSGKEQRSIELEWHIPGVYLYAQDDCQGKPVIYQASTATLPEFDNKTKSIKFIYGDEYKDPVTKEVLYYRAQYAAILHEKENYMGKAMLYDQDQGDENCKNLSENLYGDDSPTDIGVSSITVYFKPIIKDGEPQITGSGVKFFEDKSQTGCVLPPVGSPREFYSDDDNRADLHIIDRCGGDSCNSKDCGDRISSMEMDGHYIALLFDDKNYTGDCEVFTSSCADFRNHRIGQCGFWGRRDCMSSFIIKARR